MEMKILPPLHIFLLTLIAIVIPMIMVSFATESANGPQKITPLIPIPFSRVKIQDSFWKGRMETNRRVTLAANLDKCEETGRIFNFAVAGEVAEGKHEGFLYNDSDLYKVIEGAAYTLASERDPRLEARIDEIIDLIALAQQEDGYLNTYITLVSPEKRWGNIRGGHELYCAGHLIEAAVAYAQATGKEKLLEVATRFADFIDQEFGPGKRLDPPGHQEIELALMKLTRLTGNRCRENTRVFSTTIPICTR